MDSSASAVRCIRSTVPLVRASSGSGPAITASGTRTTSRWRTSLRRQRTQASWQSTSASVLSRFPTSSTSRRWSRSATRPVLSERSSGCLTAGGTCVRRCWRATRCSRAITRRRPVSHISPSPCHRQPVPPRQVLASAQVTRAEPAVCRSSAAAAFPKFHFRCWSRPPCSALTACLPRLRASWISPLPHPCSIFQTFRLRLATAVSRTVWISVMFRIKSAECRRRFLFPAGTGTLRACPRSLLIRRNSKVPTFIVGIFELKRILWLTINLPVLFV